MANRKYDYGQFREAVRERLGSILACYKLSPDELEKYMQAEESQIKGAFKNYQDGCQTLTEEACFKAEVNGVSFCLEMCYEQETLIREQTRYLDADEGEGPFYEDDSFFYRNHRDDQVWWLDHPDMDGVLEFSFNKQEVFNLFADYPWKLTPEQKNIFDRENPYWEDFFKDRV